MSTNQVLILFMCHDSFLHIFAAFLLIVGLNLPIKGCTPSKMWINRKLQCSMSFLTSMFSALCIPLQCTSFELSATDHKVFEALQSSHIKFTNAMKLFVKRNVED